MTTRSGTAPPDPAAAQAHEVMAVLNGLLPATRPVGLHEPRFTGREWAYLKDCLDTGWVSSVGA